MTLQATMPKSTILPAEILVPSTMAGGAADFSAVDGISSLKPTELSTVPAVLHVSSTVAGGAANFRSSSAEDEWEAYKQRMAVRHGMGNAGEAHLKANPSSQVSTALFGPMKAIANPPQVSTALFGSTAVFGLTTGGKPQGKTRQGVSAADFFPASRTSSKAQRNDPFSSTALFGPPRRETVADRARGALRASARTDTSSNDGAPSKANRKAASKKAAKKPRKVGGKLGVGLFINESRGGVVVSDSSDKESGGETIPDRDRAALRTLANDRNLRGTTAFRLCQAATAAKARPGWSGTGPH